MIRNLKSLGSTSLVLLVASFVTCIGQTVDLPAPSGPYPVGTTIVHWIDPSRGEPMAKDARARRELMVQIWYPARLDEKAELARYIPEFDKIFPYRTTL